MDVQHMMQRLCLETMGDVTWKRNILKHLCKHLQGAKGTQWRLRSLLCFVVQCVALKFLNLTHSNFPSLHVSSGNFGFQLDSCTRDKVMLPVFMSLVVIGKLPSVMYFNFASFRLLFKAYNTWKRIYFCTVLVVFIECSFRDEYIFRWGQQISMRQHKTWHNQCSFES